MARVTKECNFKLKASVEKHEKMNDERRETNNTAKRQPSTWSAQLVVGW